MLVPRHCVEHHIDWNICERKLVMFILLNSFRLTFGALLKSALVIVGAFSAVALFACTLIMLAYAMVESLTNSKCKT